MSFINLLLSGNQLSSFDSSWTHQQWQFAKQSMLTNAIPHNDNIYKYMLCKYMLFVRLCVCPARDSGRLQKILQSDCRVRCSSHIHLIVSVQNFIFNITFCWHLKLSSISVPDQVCVSQFCSMCVFSVCVSSGFLLWRTISYTPRRAWWPERTLMNCGTWPCPRSSLCSAHTL